MLSPRSFAAIFVFIVFMVAPAASHASEAEGFNAQCDSHKVYDLQCGKKEKRNGKEVEGGLDCPCQETDAASGKTVPGKCKLPFKCKATATAEGEKPQTCKETGSCDGPNAKPGEQKGKEGEKGGGSPPGMPSPPGGGGGGGEPKPQTPQPNQGQGASSSKDFMYRGGEGTSVPVPNDPTSQWQPYTKKESDPFTTGLDTVTSRAAATKAEAEEKPPEADSPVKVDVSNKGILEVNPYQRTETPPPPQPVQEDRYQNPPRDDSTGFMSPNERRLAADQRDPNKQDETARLDTNPQGAVPLKSIIPALLERARDLLQRLFIELSAKKAAEATKPPTQSFPWGRVSMLPSNEIQLIENFPPTKVIPILQAESGPYGKPFETMVHILCDSKMEKCRSIFSNGEPFKIPTAIERRMYEETLKEIPNVPDLKYIFLVHDHPITAIKPEFKRFAQGEGFDLDVSTPYPEQVLTGPAGVNDGKVFLPPAERGPSLQYDPKYVVTNLIIDPGGLWVSAFTSEDALPPSPKPKQFAGARTDLFLASQSNDPVRRQKAIDDLIAKGKEFIGMKIQYLPSTATDAEVMKAAIESVRR